MDATDNRADRDQGKTLNAWLYDAQGNDCELALEDAAPADLDDDQLLWIQASAPDGSARALLEEKFALVPGTIDRLLDRDRPLLLDNYGEYFSLSVLLVPEGKEPAQRFSMIMGRNWLITISRRRAPRFVAEFRKQDKGETEIGRLNAGQLLAALLDWHLAAFFAHVSEIEARVDELDETILKEASQGQVLRELVGIRRSISTHRRTLAEQRPVFYALTRPDIGCSLPDEALDAFEHLAERLERAIDEVERTRDVLVGSFDLFTSLSAQTTNELVKALTFATVVIGSFAAVAGLLGMNFKMPFFETGTKGFLSVVVVLLLASGAALWVARRRDWI